MKKILLALTALFAVSALTACSSDDGFLTDDELSSLTPMADPKFTVMLGITSSDNSFFEKCSSYDKSYAYVFHSQEELNHANITYGWSDYKYGEFSYTYKENLTSTHSNIDWNKQTLVVIAQWFPSCYPIIILKNGKIYSKKGKYYVDMEIEFGGNGIMAALSVNGIAFVINSPNVSTKDIKIQTTGNSYIPWLKKDEVDPVPFKKTYTY